MKRNLYTLLVFVAALLILMGGYFFNENLRYRSENRILILENDSLKSVLLQMNHKTGRPDKESVSDNDADGAGSNVN